MHKSLFNTQKVIDDSWFMWGMYSRWIACNEKNCFFEKTVFFFYWPYSLLNFILFFFFSTITHTKMFSHAHHGFTILISKALSTLLRIHLFKSNLSPSNCSNYLTLQSDRSIITWFITTIELQSIRKAVLQKWLLKDYIR